MPVIRGGPNSPIPVSPPPDPDRPVVGDLVEELPGTQSPARIDEMRKGMRTGAVAELQAMLQAVGAPRNTKGTVGLESDAGAFGDKTQLWVKQFQLATGLSPADGVVDEKTLLALHGAAERRESVFARSTDVGATTYGGQPLAFPKGKSPDGYRVLNQNDNPKVPLGNQSGLNANLRDQGCAVTAFAMVASHLTGQTVSPATSTMMPEISPRVHRRSPVKRRQVHLGWRRRSLISPLSPVQMGPSSEPSTRAKAS